MVFSLTFTIAFSENPQGSNIYESMREPGRRSFKPVDYAKMTINIHRHQTSLEYVTSFSSSTDPYSNFENLPISSESKSVISIFGWRKKNFFLIKKLQNFVQLLCTSSVWSGSCSGCSIDSTRYRYL